MNRTGRVIVGISGASGAAYALRVIQLLAAADVEVHLTITKFGKRLLFDELQLKSPDLEVLSGGRAEKIIMYNDGDLGATIASGSFLHDGMIVVPCSSNTLGAVASGVSQNLLQRTAAVALKERRRLVLAYRESPSSLVDLRNMTTVTEAGGIIAPLAPGFYMLPQTIDDLVDFMAGKLLDLLDIEHELNTRWGAAPTDADDDVDDTST